MGCLTSPAGQALAHACAPAGPGPPGPGLNQWLAGLNIHVPETGTCTHTRQAPGYRPPDLLRHLIKTRNRTCTYPGCRRPATRCDDDHTIPWDQGGRTCECNLHPACLSICTKLYLKDR